MSTANSATKITSDEWNSWQTCVVNSQRVIQRLIWISVATASHIEQSLNGIFDGVIRITKLRYNIATAVDRRWIGGEVMKQRKSLPATATVGCKNAGLSHTLSCYT